MTDQYFDFRFKWTAIAAIGIHPTKAWLSQLVISKMQSGCEDTLEKRYTIEFCFKLGKNCHRNLWNASDCYSTILHERASIFEWHKRFNEGRESVRGDEVWKSIHQSWLAKGLGLGLRLLCWGFKGVQEQIPSEETSISSNRVSGISTRTMHQSKTPSLSQPIWASWASRSFLSHHIVETLLPVTFGYSLSSEAVVVMRQLRRWKRLWRRSYKCSHKRTSMGPFRICWNDTTSALQPEDITSKGTRVSGVYSQ